VAIAILLRACPSAMPGCPQVQSCTLNLGMCPTFAPPDLKFYTLNPQPGMTSSILVVSLVESFRWEHKALLPRCLVLIYLL